LTKAPSDGGAGRRDRHRHLGWRKRGDPRHAGTCAVHHRHVVTAQERSDVTDGALELRRRRGPYAELEDRGVAAAEDEHRPAAGLDLQGGDRRGRDRGVPGDRVGDGDAEPQPCGVARREGELHVGITDEVLAVGEHEPVESPLLGLHGERGRVPWNGEPVQPDLHGVQCRPWRSIDAPRHTGHRLERRWSSAVQGVS